MDEGELTRMWKELSGNLPGGTTKNRRRLQSRPMFPEAALVRGRTAAVALPRTSLNLPRTFINLVYSQFKLIKTQLKK
jgi:hypothetical protein